MQAKNENILEWCTVGNVSIRCRRTSLGAGYLHVFSVPIFWPAELHLQVGIEIITWMKFFE